MSRVRLGLATAIPGSPSGRSSDCAPCRDATAGWWPRNPPRTVLPGAHRARSATWRRRSRCGPSRRSSGTATACPPSSTRRDHAWSGTAPCWTGRRRHRRAPARRCSASPVACFVCQDVAQPGTYCGLDRQGHDLGTPGNAGGGAAAFLHTAKIADRAQAERIDHGHVRLGQPGECRRTEHQAAPDRPAILRPVAAEVAQVGHADQFDDVGRGRDRCLMHGALGNRSGCGRLGQALYHDPAYHVGGPVSVRLYGNAMSMTRDRRPTSRRLALSGRGRGVADG